MNSPQVDRTAEVLAALRGMEPAAALAACSALLQENGFWVIKSSTGKESPGEYCRRVGLARGSFRRLFDRSGRPPVEFQKGPGGRVKWITASGEFDAWMTTGKQLGLGRKAAVNSRAGNFRSHPNAAGEQ